MMVAALLAACGSDPPLPVGGVCTETDECADDLTCLEIGQISGSACTVVGKACTITCTDDAGCAMFGANFKCFATCGAERICGELAGP